MGNGHHPVINYGVLVQGELTIIGQDGKEKVVHEGEAVVEMVNGRAASRDTFRITL